MPSLSGAAAALLAVAATCAVCALSPSNAEPTQGLALTEVAFTDLPGWDADHASALLPALMQQCRRLTALPPDTMLGGVGLSASYGGSAGQWRIPCRLAADLRSGDDAAMRTFMQQRFQPYRIGSPALVTGYFEPEVQGSLTRTGAFQTPMLGRPADLMQSPPPASDPLAPPVIGRRDGGHIVPYWTRSEIEAGAIGSKARTLFWLRSPIDLFFLQVQGSGRVRLQDGSVLRVVYDGRNGRPYTPIGRVLIDDHDLAAADVSMQTIRAWLDANPAQAKQVMDANDDFVFFRVDVDADSDFGPPGVMGVDLSAGRSVAVDRHFVPLGALLFIDTTDPVTHAPWRRFVLAQDIGTDIVGPSRVDVFLGNGIAASQMAGVMRQAGTEYLLLPRPSS